MGLGQDGMPLLDVRANLPSPSDNSNDNINSNMNSMGASASTGSSLMSGGNQNQANSATNVGTAALQAALVSYLSE